MKLADRIELQAELEFYGLGSLLDLFQGAFLSMAYAVLIAVFYSFSSLIDLVFVLDSQFRVAVFLWMLALRESSSLTDSKPQPLPTRGMIKVLKVWPCRLLGALFVTNPFWVATLV
jgi:hypothetical protein